MSVSPRKTEIKKFLPILEAEYDSPEDAAKAILEAAYELYEGQAKFYVVGQIRPGTGWKGPEEGRDAKVLLGPFGTLKQAQNAGESLAYSSSTGEEASWWAVEFWPGTPAKWYDSRKKKWEREGFMDGDPRHTRLAMAEDFLKEMDGAPLPDILKPNGWDGLEEFQIWLDNTEGELQEYDLRGTIREQQHQLNELRSLKRHD